MADISNDWEFKRGIDDEGFMKELKSAAKPKCWFADVLADSDLILGIRDNYLNVYRLGQSLFKAEKNGFVSTHAKYLLNPDISEQVPLVGCGFKVDPVKLLTTEYKGPETLNKMKRAAKVYRGDEKNGVHALAAYLENNVIDTEIAFNSKAEEEEDDKQPTSRKRHTPRIDLACFEEVKGDQDPATFLGSPALQ